MHTSRLLHLSDLHAHDAWYRWADGMRTHFGLVVISGELLDLNAHRPLDDQVPRVKAHLATLASSSLALVGGNRNRITNGGPELLRAQWLQDLRADSVWVDGDTFNCAGFTVRCLGWNAAAPEAADENEVWIVHAPPEGARTAIVAFEAADSPVVAQGLCFEPNSDHGYRYTSKPRHPTFCTPNGTAVRRTRNGAGPNVTRPVPH